MQWKGEWVWEVVMMIIYQASCRSPLVSRSLTVSALATLITSSFKFRSLVYGVEDKVKQQKVNYGKYPSDSELEVVLWWFWHQSLKTLCFQFITLCIFIIFICKNSVPANVISYTVLVLLRIIQNVNMHDSLEITNTVFIWEGCFLPRIQRYLLEGDLWFFCLYHQLFSGLSTIYRLWPSQGYSMSLYTCSSLLTFISLQKRRKKWKLNFV